MQLMISEVNWLRKNVTKVRAERSEKHANPHFRHGQVYHKAYFERSANLTCQNGFIGYAV